MEEHSDYAVSLLLKDYYHIMDGPNQGQKHTQVHKVDGPHQGSRQQSTKWTDPTRVKLILVHIVDRPNQGHKLTQVHKVDGPH